MNFSLIFQSIETERYQTMHPCLHVFNLEMGTSETLKFEGLSCCGLQC